MSDADDPLIEGDVGCCDDDEPQGQIINRPACFATSCSISWRLVNGRPEGTVTLDPAGGIECGPDGLRLAISTAEGCDSIFGVDPDTGQVTFAPYPFSVNECAEAESCGQALGGGDSGEPVEGCSAQVCATYTNDHCAYPIDLTPRVTIIDAELFGGPMTYELQPTINNNPAQSIVKVFGSAEDGLGNYSGSIDMDPITVAPGESIRVCYKPKVRYRADGVTGGLVNWGRLRVCLTGHANAETIGGV